MIGDRSQLTIFINKFLGTVKFGNDRVTKIMGYGYYKNGNATILRVYFVEGLGHNLFSVGQFCDSDLEVAFRQHTSFIRNLEGLVRGLPKLKFKKDHLCSACAMGKRLAGLGVLLSRGMGFIRGTLAVVVILVKGHTFPTIVKVLPAGCDSRALVGRVTHLEDSIGANGATSISTDISAEQVFWSQNSVNSEEPNLSTRPTQVEVPKEHPKTTVLCFPELFPFTPDVYVIDVPAAKELAISRRIPRSNNSSQERHHTDMVIHTVKTEMTKLVVEIKCVGMNVDEFDKETGSSDGLQPEQVDLNYVHSLKEPHLHTIHVVPSEHEAD
nr:integrase, catalytic region, zinc finger, CCHC-type, peptidase aspartic, catalytic [Tanacetum cinerariifolium]